MAINFPNSPSPNQLYSYDGKTWEWNGIYWEVYSALTSYITSAYTVGDGVSDISGVTGGNIALKSFSGVNITIIDSGSKLTFSASTTSSSVSGDYLPLSGGTVTGGTIFNSGLTANTISATTYYNLPVSGLTSSTYINATPSNGNYTISLTGPLLSYYVSNSLPGGTQVSGDRWLNTDTGDELVWIDDGDTQQWIQISSVIGGGGGTSTSTGSTLIAASTCLIESNGGIYIGYSKGGGWNYFNWDVVDSSFGYDKVDCGISVPQDITAGKIIRVCGVAYSPAGSSETLRLYIYKLSCTDLSVINNVYTSSNQIFDSNGNLCFDFQYELGEGEDFISRQDLIVLGFQGTQSTLTTIKISYNITLN